jgi:sugar-specific transcriptional regulator TrmB
MITQKLSSILKQFELNATEIAVYESLIENYNTNISNICRNLGLHRQKVYDCLYSLEKLGLVQKNSQTNKFQLANYNKIKSILLEKRQNINKSIFDFETILPLLAAHSDENKKPKVGIYENRNKFIYLLNEILDQTEKGETIYSYNENDDLYRIFDIDYFLGSWVQKRIKKQVFIKILLNGSNSLVTHIPKNHQDLREVKILPNDFSSTGCYWIVGQKIIFWDTVQEIAWNIETPILAKLLIENFELVWSKLSI